MTSICSTSSPGGNAWLKQVVLPADWKFWGIGSQHGSLMPLCYILIHFLIWDYMQKIFHGYELMPQNSEPAESTVYGRDLILWDIFTIQVSLHLFIIILPLYNSSPLPVGATFQDTQ
jgi:hypothetical protein